MEQVQTKTDRGTEGSALRQKIRASVESLSYLPSTVSVAMKFIELGKDPDAEPADYAKVIGADSALSAKLLALANSSWFGVRNKVTTVKAAVNLLGLSTVRTLAVSYCMTGLHNELGLSAEESKLFWEASLCKAVAAREYAALLDKKQADDAFVGGMFQDLAVTVIYAVARDDFLGILEDAENDCCSQLEKERALLGTDHSEVGRMLAEKLELPDLLVDGIAFHHDYENLQEFLESEAVVQALHVAALFPHVLNVWNRDDANVLCRFVDEQLAPRGVEAAVFLTRVQEEFDKLYRFFEEGAEPETRLSELMRVAAREAADNTTNLVSTVHQLLQQAAMAGSAVNELLAQQSKLEEKATRDPLTGALNREGFESQAETLLAKATRYGVGFAIVYFDVDRFKEVNDSRGHRFGDLALKTVVTRMTESVREHDLVGRLGGDEFALLLYDCEEEKAQGRVRQIVSGVSAQPIGRGKHTLKISVSAGCLWVRPTGRPCSLETLLGAADKLMYKSKQAGGNQVTCRRVQA